MIIPNWLDAYFSLYSQGDALRFLEAHDAGSLILTEGSSRVAGTVDPSCLALEHAARQQGPAALLPYVGHRLERMTPRGDRAVAHVRLDLAVEPFQARVGFALRRQGEDWKIAGVAWEPPEGLSFAALLALAAAEFAYLPPEVARYATGLDLAFQRLVGTADATIEVLPGTRFSCHMSGKCCGKWGIGVSDAAVRAFEQVDWAEVVEIPVPATYLQAPDSPEKPFRMATQQDRCVFMIEQRCAIHAALGTPFNPTCMTYPIGFVRTPDGACATLSFNCPSARDNLGSDLTECKADLRQRWWLWGREALVIGEEVPLRRGVTPVSWSCYRGLEARWLALLEDPAIPIPSALGKGLAALRALPAGWTEADLAKTFADPLELCPELPSFGMDLLGAMTFAFLSQFAPEALSAASQLPFERMLALHGYMATQPIAYHAPEGILRRYLRQVLFRKRILAELGVVEQLHFTVLAAAFLRTWASFMAYREGRDATNDQDFLSGLEALEVGSHHSPGFSKILGSDPYIRASLSSDRHADGWLALVQR